MACVCVYCFVKSLTVNGLRLERDLLAQDMVHLGQLVGIPSDERDAFHAAVLYRACLTIDV